MFESRYFRVFWSVLQQHAITQAYNYTSFRGADVKFKLINEHQQVTYSAMTN